MTLIEDYGLNSQSRTLLLLVLSIDNCNHKKAMDKLHIQKIIRLFEHIRQKKSIDFSNFKLGGVSDEIEENLEYLIDYGFIEQADNYFALTLEGDNGANLLRHTFDVAEFNKLVYATHLLRDLPNDETLYFMYKTIPTTQEHSTEILRLERKAESLVKSLFLKRKIDVATAAKWLDISLADFVKKFHKKALSAEVQQALVEGYLKSADEDLAIAKEFESIDHEFDCECDM
jgi:hypothetical protein